MLVRRAQQACEINQQQKAKEEEMCQKNKCCFFNRCSCEKRFKLKLTLSKCEKVALSL